MSLKINPSIKLISAKISGNNYFIETRKIKELIENLNFE
jgi:hypothetical protein